MMSTYNHSQIPLPLQTGKWGNERTKNDFFLHRTKKNSMRTPKIETTASR